MFGIIGGLLFGALAYFLVGGAMVLYSGRKDLLKVALCMMAVAIIGQAVVSAVFAPLSIVAIVLGYVGTTITINRCAARFNRWAQSKLKELVWGFGQSDVMRV